MKEIARKKAILLAGGKVKVPDGLRLPVLPSRSTAGPGAGSIAIVLQFDGHRVKKAISREEGEFELVAKGKEFSLLRKGEMFLGRVNIQPTLAHSPEQAFYNIGTDCIYECKFCTARRLEKRKTKDLTPERIVQLILEQSKRLDFKAVALTSAVVGSPKETTDRMLYIVSEVRKALPEVPIGVEPYVDDLHDIDRLKNAGADEIKLNVESWDSGIFRKVCGELDLEWILSTLERAVAVFGRGKVCSNIIYGLGETDENVLDGVEMLASMGVVATLRPLRINELNEAALKEALGTIPDIDPERILRLAEGHKRILERHGLDTRSFKTMCHACTCCDVVPFRDI
ncbi:MAG: radical SAM protein [Methanomassiliicoccales archaeon]|nr:radical SAM protein [Methanomassiliicoccales archaeon]